MGGSAKQKLPPVAVDYYESISPYGNGYFSSTQPLDNNGSTPALPAQAKGPAIDLQAAQITPTNTGGSVAAVKTQPPPKTKPSITTVANKKNNFLEIEIKLKTLADGINTKPNSRGAVTSFSFEKLSISYPGLELDANNKITKFTSKFKVVGTVPSQTLYSKTAKATDISLYGRGTTQADKAAGNITLGFHESCHHIDFLNYLKNNPIPELKIKISDSLKDYDDAVAQYPKELEKYRVEMEKDSHTKTDEVGYTLTQCKKDGNC